MLKVVGRRLAVAIPMLLIITTLAFFLVSIIPGDPAASILGPDATPAEYAAVREELGLNEPLVVQYASWMSGLFAGDLGDSIRTGRAVLPALVERLPVTLSLAVLATVVTLLAGVALGLVSVLRGGGIGRSAQVASVVGTSLPNFWVGILLVFVFSIWLGILPATGYVAFGDDPGMWAASLVLPVVAVAIAGVAAIARQTRASMNDVLSRDFVRTLLAAGTPRSVILYKHVLRNAAIPVVTSMSFQFIHLLGGSIVIEQVFALPGLGQALIVAISSRDIPVVQGVVVITAILVIIVNLCVDLVNAWLNPKVRVA
jgi:peptide/nickel transport system permease protein